jgi:hypothetical protein
VERERIPTVRIDFEFPREASPGNSGLTVGKNNVLDSGCTRRSNTDSTWNVPVGSQAAGTITDVGSATPESQHLGFLTCGLLVDFAMAALRAKCSPE